MRGGFYGGVILAYLTPFDLTVVAAGDELKTAADAFKSGFMLPTPLRRDVFNALKRSG